MSDVGPDSRFAIALSFPGEHRRFVQGVANQLIQSGKLSRQLVFYDKWHQVSLYGSNLDETLARIYGEQSDLVVPFFSEHYGKFWCGVEWDIIRPLLLNCLRRNTVLPVHMDGTAIPGWDRKDLGIRRGRQTSAQIADVILKKYLSQQWDKDSSQVKTSSRQTTVISPPSLTAAAAAPAALVFVTHHTSDIAFAREVKARLAVLRAADGSPVCTPWLAADDLEAGDNYRNDIDEALRQARAIVVILSPDSVNSMYVTYEWAYAMGRGIPVIPILRQTTRTHPRLELLHYLSFQDPANPPWEKLGKCLLQKLMKSKVMTCKPSEIQTIQKEVESEIAKQPSLQHDVDSTFRDAGVDALVIIDVQRDFFASGALPVPNAESLIAPLNRAIDAAQRRGIKLIFTRDWHPPDHHSFVNMSPKGAWPRHCVRNTPGAEFHPKLKVPQDSVILNIGADNQRLGYSAFEDQTLSDLIGSFEIGTLYIAGIALEYCVQATALEAAGKSKSKIVILEKLVRAANPNRRELASLWKELKQHGVERHVGAPPFLYADQSLQSIAD